MKNKFLTPLIFLSLLIALGVYSLKHAPEGKIPYPYKFRLSPKSFPSTINEAHILIVGDQMAKSLTRYQPLIQQKIQEISQLKNPPRIRSIAEEHLSAARLLPTLKNLTKIPPVLVYMGGNEELFEKSFLVNEGFKILSNLKQYENPFMQTTIMGIPLLTKFVYQGVKRITLTDEIKPDLHPYPGNLKQKQMEISLKLFETQIEEFIQWSLSKETQLIVITTPINIDPYPKKVCENSTSNEIITLQNHLFNLMNQNQNENPDQKSEENVKVLNELKDLVKLSPGNALSVFMLGQYLLKQGQRDNGIEQLRLSSMLDCQSWRATWAHNQILRRLTKKYDIPLVDFDLFLNNDFGKNVLFIDETIPQDLYFQKVIQEELIPNINLILDF